MKIRKEKLSQNEQHFDVMKNKLEHEAATRIQKVARKYATKLAQERAQNKGSKGTGKNKKNIKRK